MTSRGEASIGSRVISGSLQCGVLSLLLWKLVEMMDGIGQGNKQQGYVDDLMIVARDEFLDTLKENQPENTRSRHFVCEY